jgi:hypothetical protein
MAKLKPHKPATIDTGNIGAAAVDIGLREHLAAVNSEVSNAPMPAFGTFMHDLADWFKSRGVPIINKRQLGARRHTILKPSVIRAVDLDQLAKTFLA